MQESGQRREIGFLDLFKIIFKRFFVILVAVILAAGVGALYAYSKNKNVNYYGATAHYKISVSSVMKVNGNEQGEPSGSNYLYKEEHLSMLVDDLTSDKFIRDHIVSDLENAPGYNPEASEEEADNFYTYLLYVKSCIRYTYDYAKNPNAIQVSVTVLNNKEFAKKLLEQVKVAVPEFIVENMIKPAPEDVVSSNAAGVVTAQRIYTTECEETSMSRIRLVNGGQMQSSIAKYAVLAGFLAAVAACIAVVVLDYTDTRVRDPEEFATRSDLPLLGTLPKSALSETEVKA